jgi:hypothetical protein
MGRARLVFVKRRRESVIRTSFSLSAFLMALCFAPALSYAQDAAPVTFNLPGHGKLLLLVPKTWNVEVHPRLHQLAPIMELSQKSGAPFHVAFTPMWTPSSDTPYPNDTAVRDQVAASAKQLESQSVEPTLLVKELSGKLNSGYYFTATDRAPKPDEFKYLTEGMIRIGAIDLAFTVVTNDGQDSVVNSALDILRAATHVPL